MQTKKKEIRRYTTKFINQNFRIKVFGRDENGKRIERSVYSRKWVNNPCADTKVYMTLSGLWSIENADGVKIEAKHSNGNTVLEFTSKEARTEEITLKKID